jgi:integrative and conjugative element protein (TIGR02256 family)
MVEGQRLARDQLRELVAASNGAIEMVIEPSAVDSDGWLRATISLDCTGTPSSAAGIRLHQRERFILLVPSGFPFDMPVIRVPHRRWAGTPHVQWGDLLCLYAAPSIEWVPADGMFGLMERLVSWLERAALGELDPDDQPLHPPVAYTSGENGVIVVRADLGELAPVVTDPGRRQLGARPTGTRSSGSEGSYRIVVGITEAKAGERLDVVEWVSRTEWLRRFSTGQLPPVRCGRRIGGTVAVLTDREMGFEYPKQAARLVADLEDLGVPREELFTAIGEVGAVNYELACQRAAAAPVVPADLFLFVGTPSRRVPGGPCRQHLVCWRFDELGRLVAENLSFADAEQPALARLGELARQLLPDWVAITETSWVQVMEAREEVTVRRDMGSSAQWLVGRRVLVLGCGALGGPIVEFCVRGGAAAVYALDNGVVTPGILVRQPYTDSDIGAPKALALATRLNRIRLDEPVHPITWPAQIYALAEGAPPPDVDLVIDATANSAVASMLELRRARSRAAWPPVISVMIGHDARRGVVTVTKAGATGAGRDQLRRLLLAGRIRHENSLEDVAADFFPLEPRTALFQPEPGCSSPTFIGSAADLAALAGHLFDAGLSVLWGNEHAETAEQPMVTAVIRLDGWKGSNRPGVTWFGWPDDLVIDDPDRGYEVRISQPALSRIRAEVRRGARLRGPEIETGGLLLGQIDDACRCIWVDDVSGPPPDSLLSAVHFDHGIEGVEQLVAYHRQRSGRVTTFVGMWHSHPYGEALPSPTDKAGMRTLLTPLAQGPSRALILIVGGNKITWPRWVIDGQAPDVFARLVTRATKGARREALPVPSSHRTDGWPGGWGSRPQPITRQRRRGRTWRLRLFRSRQIS